MRVVALFALASACGGDQHGAERPRAPRAPVADRSHDAPDRLYVEIAADRRALRDGAHAGLETVDFASPARGNADVALQVEVSRLDTVSNVTTCSVKILVVRLPQHDLLGIADGSAQAHGTDGQARDDCLTSVTTSLVRGKVRGLLQQRLDSKQ